MDSKALFLLFAWVFVGVMTTITILTNKAHHPKALFYLFFVELWERFSYYGMRALLMLYMVKGMMYPDGKAAGIYAAYVALVYATPVLGGYLSEKILGARLSIMLGAVLMAIGHLAMAVESDFVFLMALGFLIMGNGFFKPNISSLIGKFYKEGDPKRDSGFTIFYMGINSGAFLAPLTCGYVEFNYGYHLGFAMAGIGMLSGLAFFIYAKQKGVLEDKGFAPKNEALEQKWNGLYPRHWVIVGAFLAVPLIMMMVKFSEVSEVVLYLVSFSVIIYLFILSMNEEKTQREKLWVILVLFLFTTLFFTFFELAGSALTLYTERNVDRNVPGMGLIPTSQFQAINPLFIILLAPLFSMLWEKFNKVTIPQKFALSMFQIGVGFFVLVWAKGSANTLGLVPVAFIVLMYFFHTTAELCISPIGLSLVTKLSPQKLVGFVMGIWLLSSTVAGLLGGLITKITSGQGSEEAGAKLDALAGLATYTDVFNWIGWVCIAAGIILGLMTGTLKKWMHGIQ